MNIAEIERVLIFIWIIASFPIARFIVTGNNDWNKGIKFAQGIAFVFVLPLVWAAGGWIIGIILQLLIK